MFTLPPFQTPVIVTFIKSGSLKIVNNFWIIGPVCVLDHLIVLDVLPMTNSNMTLVFVLSNILWALNKKVKFWYATYTISKWFSCRWIIVMMKYLEVYDLAPQMSYTVNTPVSDFWLRITPPMSVHLHLIPLFSTKMNVAGSNEIRNLNVIIKLKEWKSNH